MLKNITWTVSARYFAQGLSVLANVLLARYLGADGFGEYALASSVLLIGNAFSNFGMDMILIRKFSLDNDHSFLVDGLWLQLFLSVIYIFGLLIFDYFVSLPISLKIYILTLLPLSFYSIFTIAVRARQQMWIFSIAQVLTAVLQLFAVFGLWLLHGDVITFAILFLLAQILVASWGFAFHVLHYTHFHFSFQRLIAMLKTSFYMAVIGTLRLVYEKLPITLLPALTGLSPTGLYSAASRVLDAGKLGHFSAFTAMYPEMTRDEDFGKQMRGLRSLLMAAFLITGLVYLLAAPIVLVLFGKEFLPAVLPLKILAWMIVPYVIVTYTSLGLVAMGIEKPVLLSLIVALGSLLILFIFLTSQFGLIGSAVAVLFAEIIHALFLWLQWRKHVLSKLP